MNTHEHAPRRGFYQWSDSAQRFIASNVFFWLIIVVFAFEAIWVAISARFPQAFDEQFHFGLIQLYSHHFSPFLSNQPPGANQFGAVYRDTSYLYHYLMSFPYRLVAHLTPSQTAQIIVLRICNVGFFVTGLVLARRLLNYVRISPGVRNVSLLLIAFMPVMSQLAGQINYDNAIFPLSCLFLLLGLRLVQQMKFERSVHWNDVMVLLIVGTLTSLVKYAFLPIFAAMIVIALVYTLQYVGTSSLRQLWQWLRRPVSWILLLTLALSTGMFWQRDGINTVRYHTPIPECDQVLEIDDCMAYGPWARNYMFHQSHDKLHANNVLTYPFIWVYHMQYESVFTITSYYDNHGVLTYGIGTELLLPEVLYWTVFGVGLLLGLRYWRWLWQQEALRLLLIISIGYVAVLFLQNFNDYLHVGYPVAIHGRYLLPLLVVFIPITGLLIQHALVAIGFQLRRRTLVQIGAAIVIGVILLFEGGGFGTFIVRSDSSWFWQQLRPVQHVNAYIQQVLKHIVIDGE